MTRTRAPGEGPKAPKKGQASEEAIEKRRAARRFNDVLLGGTGKPNRLDGRTAKRRLRLLDELRRGTSRSGNRELKPIDVLLRIQALLDLDEPLTSLRKASRPPRLVPETPVVIEGVRSLHAAYGFSPAAYQFVGIDEATLKRAGIRSAPGPKSVQRAAASRERAA